MHIRWKRTLTVVVSILTATICMGCGETPKTKEAMQLIEELDYQGALTVLEEAEELNENARLIARGRGIASMGLTDYESAVTYFKEALALSDGMVQNVDFDLNFYLAAAYTRIGEYTLAEKTYNAILALRPEEKEAYFLRGNVRMALNRYVEAKEDFDKVVAMEPANYDRIIDIYEILAHYGYKEIGQEYLQNVLNQGEKKLTANVIGRIYYYLEEYQKAYIALEEAKNKGGLESYLYLGRAYEATGDYNYAISVYNSYLGKAGESAEVYNQLGLCQMKIKEYRKALEAFEAGMALGDKDMQQALAFNQVVAYEYLGEYAEANKKLADYLRSYPDDETAIREKAFLSTR